MISFWIDRINAEYRIAHSLGKDIDLIKFVDQDEAYSGGRMCRQGITEPDRDNVGNYWYNLGSKRKGADGTIFTESLVDASAYASIDINTCEAAADASGRMEDMLSCFIAQEIAQGQPVQNDDGTVSPASSGDIYPQLSESLSKTFHPTPRGFAQTVSEIQSRLQYRRISDAETYANFGGKPTGKKLKIMGIGDSITWGTGSGSGYGYRAVLWSELSQSNQVTFLGTQSNGADANYNRMEGYSGQTVSQIRDSVTNSNALSQLPNVVILMAGTNDVKDVDGVTLDPNLGIALVNTTLDPFIDKIFAAVPNVLILVNHILSIGMTANYGTTISDAQKRVNIYNAAISAMVARKRSQGMKILKVHTTVPYQQKVDVLHPNDDGHSRIGDDILERLANAYDLGWLTEAADPTQPTPPNTGCDIPVWIPQGQLADGATLGTDYYPGYTCVDG
jgi:lysophospholipase L1-like esterase